MRIPFINYEIVGHDPMSPPKGDDGQRIPNPTFLQRLSYGGGPLPFKLGAPQQKQPLPYQLAVFLFETAAPAASPVTLPFDVGALDNDALALALKNGSTRGEGCATRCSNAEGTAFNRRRIRTSLSCLC